MGWAIFFSAWVIGLAIVIAGDSIESGLLALAKAINGKKKAAQTDRGVSDSRG